MSNALFQSQCYQRHLSLSALYCKDSMLLQFIPLFHFPLGFSNHKQHLVMAKVEQDALLTSYVSFKTQNVLTVPNPDHF